MPGFSCLGGTPDWRWGRNVAYWSFAATISAPPEGSIPLRQRLRNLLTGAASRAAHRSTQAEDLFSHLVALVTDYAIFLLDTTGQVRSWNAGAEKIKGYAAAEIIGRHFSIFYPEEVARRGRPQEALRIARTTGRFHEQ